MTASVRVEKDSMGPMEVPGDALWGASTQRGVENFPISGYRFGRRFIRALGLVKLASSRANRSLELLSPQIADLIEKAALDVIDGRLDAHFVLDIFQTGSGTSTNMNANEVISNRAIQLAGGTIGSKTPVHPNDHVNMAQSSNDVIPTAMHVSAAEAIQHDLSLALKHLAVGLDRVAGQFASVVKIGRTHLQDATPITLGQEFSGFARQAWQSIGRCEKAIAALCELPIGGTAVGTGINAHPETGRRVAAELATLTGIPFVEAVNHFEAQATKDAFVEASGQVRAIAVSLTKIANDIRWLSSGPRCGLGEIRIPATQPGSSIMPGKVNPVMCEMLLQTCAFAIGNDATVTFAGATLGNFDLHVGMPVMAHSLLESVRLLSSAVRVFADRCVAGIDADADRCRSLIELSLAMCTSLAPEIGYDRAAEIAKKAFAQNKTVRQICEEERIIPGDKLKSLLDPLSMTMPHADKVGSGGG